MHLNKDRVRLRFARAAETYDQQAVIQLKVARRLMELMKKHLGHSPERILEIGCCTGLLTTRLYKQFQDDMTAFYVNDLVPDFETVVSKRLAHDPLLEYLPGDIEEIELPDDIDLVVSSSTFHWLADLPGMFRKLQQSIAEGGFLCFSIYGPDNLREIRELTGVGLDYFSMAELQDMVGSFFDILSCSEEQVELPFADPLAILNHLRQTGVNAIDQAAWTRSRLEQFIREYKTRFITDGQVRLTYHPLYCLARQKS